MKVFIHGSFLLCRPKEGGFSRPKGAGICRLRAAKPHPPFSFPRKKTGGVTVQKKGVRLAVLGLNKPFASGMRMPARGDAAFSIAIRFASASTIRCCAAVGGFAALRMRHTPCGCRSAYLAIVQPNSRLPRHPSMRRAPAMPLFRTQSAAEKTSLAPHDSKARLRPVTTRRDSWRSHVHRTYTAQRVQLFKPKTRNGNLSLGGFKGGYSLSRKRVSPFCPFPTPGGGNERGSPLLL